MATIIILIFLIYFTGAIIIFMSIIEYFEEKDNYLSILQLAIIFLFSVITSWLGVALVIYIIKRK